MDLDFTIYRSILIIDRLNLMLILLMKKYVYNQIVFIPLELNI